MLESTSNVFVAARENQNQFPFGIFPKIEVRVNTTILVCYMLRFTSWFVYMLNFDSSCDDNLITCINAVIRLTPP